MQNMSYPQKQHWDSDSDEAKPEYDGPFAHALESGTPSRLRVEVTRHDSVV